MGVSRPPLIVLSVAVALLCASCQENDPIDTGVDPPDMSCIDHDNDGYGVNCEDGLDCDDLDDSVWDSCDPNASRCSIPRAACPCEIEGEELACRTVEPVVSEDGSELCYAGIRTCVDGAWSTCENMEPYLPGGVEGPTPDNGADREALIGTSTDCPGSCEEACQRFYDCPSGIDIPSFAASSNIRYDLELTYGADSYQPAIVVDDVDSVEGGYARIFESDCPYGTLPYWWSIDPVVSFPDPQWAALEITASTSDDAGTLEACGLASNCGDTANVMTCEPPGGCPVPDYPQDRVFVEDGNLMSPDSWSGDPMNPRLKFLRVLFWFDLGAAGRVPPPPRLEHYSVYYFCDPSE